MKVDNFWEAGAPNFVRIQFFFKCAACGDTHAVGVEGPFTADYQTPPPPEGWFRVGFYKDDQLGCWYCPKHKVVMIVDDGDPITGNGQHLEPNERQRVSTRFAEIMKSPNITATLKNSLPSDEEWAEIKRIALRSRVPLEHGSVHEITPGNKYVVTGNDGDGVYELHRIEADPRYAA